MNFKQVYEILNENIIKTFDISKQKELQSKDMLGRLEYAIKQVNPKTPIDVQYMSDGVNVDKNHSSMNQLVYRYSGYALIATVNGIKITVKKLITSD